MHRFSRLRAAVAALTAACAAATAVPASPLGAQIAPGSTLVFTGVADATDVGTPGVVLDFDRRVNADATANTGTFASLNRPNGANGAIDDIRVGNGPQLLDTFLRIGAYTFDLRMVPSGTYGQDDCYVWPTVGQQCTPYQSVVGNPADNVGLSPFFLENLPSGDPEAPFTATVAFRVLGTVTGPGRATSEFFGTIGTTFEGQSYQEALYALEEFGLQGVTFTGTFVAGPAPWPAAPLASGPSPRPATSRVALPSGAVVLLAETVVPEPSTVILLATGLGVLGVGVHRRRRA